jgi:anaerobic magnesium-protoporphyrin IX monomethyl ester cyclase
VIILFNPKSNTLGKPVLPMSVLSLAAVLEGRYEYSIVDGNLTENPLDDLRKRINSDTKILAITVMPGRQLRQAIEFSKTVKAEYPAVSIVWGGYFPTMHSDIAISAPYVDFLFRGHTEIAFVALVDALVAGSGWRNQAGLSWRDLKTGAVHHNPEGPVPDLNALPDYPYHRIDMKSYMIETCLGSKTIPHHASYGCPFTCNFCGVVNMVGGRYSAQSAEHVESVVATLVDKYGANAIQFFDNNFFVSEARTAKICERLKPFNVSWWAYARIDTLMKYSDKTWTLMRDSGLKMAYLGAEASSDEALKRMNKGGKQTVDQALLIAERMKQFDIIPEMSFVMGSPPDPAADIEQTIQFIRRIKAINSAAEIILYLYTPVPLAGNLYKMAQESGFEFPKILEEWGEDKWIDVAERTTTDLPWLAPSVRRKLGNFQRVLQTAFPTETDPNLIGARRTILRMAGMWRYKLQFYSYPLELRILNRLVPHNRPEVAGF